ncbi:ArsR/SmtB family transcription factor [Virgifigura deserti]|uniref:ArsR/SmtB family transcription factor n=1 Tax=Virgifigura deserti TaxID=2268457 RepID=UPI003CCC2510
MNAGPHIAEVAALIGDPARANILTALMDGRALTATELSYRAGVSPQTTSGHLAKLTESGLLAVESQGRHRYFRLATPAVAQAVEALMMLTTHTPPRYRPPSREDQAIRLARTCYDHLAGKLGVAVTEALLDRACIEPVGRDYRVTATGDAFLRDLGIDLDKAKRQRRAFARQCLDWSERRPHLAGALGAALATRGFELGWISRAGDGRALQVSAAGHKALNDLFGVALSG